jgi:hypothetical protein
MPAEEVVLVAGNHDQSIQTWGLPEELRCHYLEDAGGELVRPQALGHSVAAVAALVAIKGRRQRRLQRPRVTA